MWQMEEHQEYECSGGNFLQLKSQEMKHICLPMLWQMQLDKTSRKQFVEVFRPVQPV